MSSARPRRGPSPEIRSCAGRICPPDGGHYQVRVLGVVTARGGSKGLPGKNLRPLAGKPLIAHTIDTARESGAFDRVILSTDDEAIATAGRTCGCEVPFMRPAELARDETPHLPVLQHA